MKRKANAVEAAPLPTCSAVSPDDLVIVSCTSGETFLIERNCALMSIHCREVLLLWENAIRRVASQSRGEQNSCSLALSPTEAVAVGFSSGERGGAGGGGGIRSLADPVDGRQATIPFMSAWDDTMDGGDAAVVHHVPLVTVAERYQQRMDAATPTKVDRPSSSKVASSHGDRKGMVVVPKPISPLAPLEDERGGWLYPVVQLAHVTTTLLESSLAYACRKYKVDIDGEKMAAESVPAVCAIATGEQWHMIAAAVLTGM